MRATKRPLALILASLALPFGAGCASTIMNVGYINSNEIPAPCAGARQAASGIATRAGGGSPVICAIDFLPSAALDTVLAPITVPAWIVRGEVSVVVLGRGPREEPCQDVKTRRRRP